MHRILMANVEEVRLLGGQRCMLVNNIKIDLREIGWEGLNQ
jgi:hypothetical protein